jgi:predicted RNA-binding Zn-ribbon protein involved in translation (DUF1610 family)
MTTASANIPATMELNCTQCGGALHPDEGQIFLNCPYCGATVFVDRSRVVMHWYVAPTLDAEKATAALYRWMSGSQTVKDLDKKARVVGQSFEYFPVWYFRRPTPNGGEVVVLRPAAATSVTELGGLALPAGDLRKYDSSLDPLSQAPNIPLQTALEWAGGQEAEKLPAGEAAAASGGGAFSEAALVHVPVFFFKYVFRGSTYTAIVDAASGVVLASLYPVKQEAPYRLVAGVTALVYLCLAVIPLVMGFGDEGGAGAGLLVCGGLGLLAAPFLFAWAFSVASKV